MFNGITYMMVGPLPLIAYVGMVTLFLLLFTAAISILNKRGYRRISFKWHPRIAKITILFAIVHALMGLLSYV